MPPALPRRAYYSLMSVIDVLNVLPLVWHVRRE